MFLFHLYSYFEIEKCIFLNSCVRNKVLLPYLLVPSIDFIHFKGNPNSQSILNWIIQILHYYYRKQHKNVENSQIIEQNLIIFSLCLSSVYCGLCFLHLPRSSVFQFFKHHKWSFVKYIVSLFWFENGFLQVKPS